MAAHVDYESPPKRCPVCGYSLVGLPSNHRCPECGEAYDERTKVWRPKTQWPLAIGAMAILIPALLNSLLRILLLNTHRRLNIVSFLVFLTAFLWLMLSHKRKGWCIAVLPRGIYAREGRRKPFIEWKNVHSMKVIRGLGGGLDINHGVFAITICRWFSVKLRKEILAAAEERRAEYHAKQPRIVESSHTDDGNNPDEQL